MKKFLTFVFISFLGFSLFAQTGVKFEFQHKIGDSYSYISTVQEDVFINNVLSHHSEIINRISSTVQNVTSDGEGFIDASYMTTENTISNRSGRNLTWGDEEISFFARKKSGELTISNNIFMPTVRNVPVFPKEKIKIGQTWTADGKEVHDLRTAFNMKKPLIIPFTANYKYTGNVIENGKTLNVIQVEYDFYYQNTRENLLRGQTLLESAGFSKQTLYWDNKKGLLDHYDEEFQIQIADIYQNIYTFQGSAKAEITEFKSVNDDKTLHSLQEEVAQMELNDISITKGEKGLTISLENIQFEPDSNVLRASEKIKLEKIAQLLQNYSNDLLITGHCAERGTENARQILSEERAQSVASYLIELGLRDEYHIFTQGKGSTEPVASNETEEGRSRNRRVEIIIMD